MEHTWPHTEASVLIRKLMKKQKVNQCESAELLGVSQATISKWLNGKRHMSNPAKKLIEILIAE